MGMDNLIMIYRVAIAFQNQYNAVGMEDFYTGISNNLESEVTVLLNHIA